MTKVDISLVKKETLNKAIIDKIDTINNELRIIEKKAYVLAKKEHQRVLKRVLEKENDIIDYELHVNIAFYFNEEEIALYKEYFKPNFLLDRKSNFNDNQNHNATSTLYPHSLLNVQKHCWLLHHLYGDVALSWEQILSIDTVSIDIEVIYKYEESLK